MRAIKLWRGQQIREQVLPAAGVDGFGRRGFIRNAIHRSCCSQARAWYTLLSKEGIFTAGVGPTLCYHNTRYLVLPTRIIENGMQGWRYFQF